jgi:hypothetical protein
MGNVKNPPSWSHQSSCFERDSGTGFLLCPSVGPHTPKGILVPPAGGGGSTLRNIDAWSSVLFPAKPEKFDRPSTNGTASDPRAADARKFDVPIVRRTPAIRLYMTGLTWYPDADGGCYGRTLTARCHADHGSARDRDFFRAGCQSQQTLHWESGNDIEIPRDHNRDSTMARRVACSFSFGSGGDSPARTSRFRAIPSRP